MNRITDRDQVQEGDTVAWGGLGYIHKGVVKSNPAYWDGELSVNGSIDWIANFLWAERGVSSGIEKP